MKCENCENLVALLESTMFELNLVKSEVDTIKEIHRMQLAMLKSQFLPKNTANDDASIGKPLC